MRRRSGALYSDSEEKYINIAIKCQKSDNLFSSSFEDEEEIEMPERRSLSSELTNFDYNSTNNVIYPSSFPPKMEEIIDHTDPINFLSLNGGSSSHITFQNRSLENEENNSTKLARLMVLGEILTGKKTFVNSMFPIKSKNKSSNWPKNSLQNYCLDLIVHSVTTKENEKIIYKFWIQNLSNEKFDNIIKIYYKSIDLFVLVFDAEKPASLDKLEKSYQNIQKMFEDQNVQAILVAMHNKKKGKEIDHSKAEKFVKDNKIKEFFKVHREDKNNASILEKISEVILPEDRIKIKECKFN